MNGIELYQENVVRKVGGKWALVSRSSGRPLAYWKGSGKPPEWWIKKQEARIQYFKHAKEAPNPDATPAAKSEGISGGTVALIAAGVALTGGVGYLIYKLTQKPQATPTKTTADLSWPNDVGKQAAIRVGQTLNIALPPADGSTGYAWHFTSGDGIEVQLISNRNANGGTFSFQGHKPGVTGLRFDLVSPTGQSSQSWQIPVTVSA
jgi:hypothetical protein